MNVCVVGTGYVGLVTGLCLSAVGHDVVCVDRNPLIIQSLERGVPTIHEAGLQALLVEQLGSGRFEVSDSLTASLFNVSMVMIAVGTPSQNGRLDLSQVYEVLDEIASFIIESKKYLTIVIKSTVLPGTTDTLVRERLSERLGASDLKFGLGMNPEFLREGSAIRDFMFPDRIVLGCDDKITESQLTLLYEPWNVEKLYTTTRTAEMVKYCNNTILAAQISLVNELANIAAGVGGIDMAVVLKGVSLDKRWSPIEDGKRIEPGIIEYLRPGCGFGGSCFPKDLKALRWLGVAEGQSVSILDAILETNESQPLQVVKAIERILGDLDGRRVLILGLSFKEGTDDVRETPALGIVNGLLGSGACVSVHDPISTRKFADAYGSELKDIVYVDNWISTLAESDAVILVTLWKEYLKLYEHASSIKLLCDARRALDHTNFPGSAYCSIGFQRPPILEDDESTRSQNSDSS